MAPEIPNDIILYWYVFSPYARRIAWYLQLRGINFAQCLQPPTLPRPDLEALNVNYRRIPILSIGKTFYCDTRLILRKLEARFPDGALGASDPEQRALERLLERWTVDGGVFRRAASLIPTDLPTMRDAKFRKDREGFSGASGSWSKEALDRGRPESVAHIRDAFELLETTLLADGREWVFKTANPSLGDIEAIWPFHWLVDMKGALPPSVISETQFPKVYAWINRFKAALKATRSNIKPVTVKGPEVVDYISKAKVAESVGEVDANDPLGFKAGEEVEVWPIDSGFTHRDRGILVTLTPHEATIVKKTRDTGDEIHVCVPRWGFRLTRVGAGGTKL